MEHLGIYVHIPFCVRKCAYCDFSSWAGRMADMPRYVDALCHEIRTRTQKTDRLTADTIFFGGGTPSLLSKELFEQITGTIKECFDLTADCEFTVESNPGTLTQELADAMVACSVNRLSMGMQCAQSHLLKQLNRIHSMDDVRHAVAIARSAGIRQLNLDLMLGLPGQTTNDIHETLHEALALSPDHISCYALIVEEGTPLCRDIEDGKLALPGDDLDREMYEICRQTLLAHGYEQYEISNFSLPGKRCRHNENCWNYQPYLGFGCAAHSFYNGQRRANPASLNDYLNGESPQLESISAGDAMFEYIMLGLRLTEGVSEANFEKRFAQPLMQKYGKQLTPPLHDGRLCRKDGRIFLSTHGMDVMNSVLVELL